MISSIAMVVDMRLPMESACAGLKHHFGMVCLVLVVLYLIISVSLLKNVFPALQDITIMELSVWSLTALRHLPSISIIDAVFAPGINPSLSTTLASLVIQAKYIIITLANASHVQMAQTSVLIQLCAYAVHSIKHTRLSPIPVSAPTTLRFLISRVNACLAKVIMTQ